MITINFVMPFKYNNKHVEYSTKKEASGVNEMKLKFTLMYRCLLLINITLSTDRELLYVHM
jgi:hypothetical protein